MHRLKLQSKLFIAYIGISVLILLTFSLFFYNFVTPQAIQQEVDSLAVQNEYFMNQIDGIINDMDAVSININYSSLVKSKLDTSFNLNISRDTLDNLASLFVTINGADVKVDQINLYDLNGHMLKVGIKTNTDSFDIKSLSWFQKILEADGKKMISTPYQTNSLSASNSASDWFLSLYRSYKNQYGQTVGAVETVKRSKNVFKSITSYQKKNSNPAQVYIYSSDHQLIYPYSLSVKDLEKLPDYDSFIKEGSASLSVVNPVTGKKEYLTYATSSYSGWTYISAQKESYILKPVYHLLRMLLLFVLILLAASLIISYLLSRSLVKPISHLKHIIQRMELDTLGEESTGNYNTSFNELYELFHAFQLMSEKLKYSMNELIKTREQELRSRALALQSQVNPHFYYNTLSSIIVLTENEQPQEVITMCRYLSQIMRYITETSSTEVKIRTEIEYINKYLYCMKVRYQSSLNYTIDIDERLMEYHIPKLLIQPLVENAIKYGTDCLPPWKLSITGRLYDDRWIIDVMDSGNGFCAEAIKTIDERIQEADQNPGIQNIHTGGLGLINIYMRWKMFCQENMIFRYGNTEDGHGIVSIGRTLKPKKEKDCRSGSN